MHTATRDCPASAPDQGAHKAVASLQANGHLQNCFVEKQGVELRGDSLSFAPARKKRLTKKRNTKA